MFEIKQNMMKQSQKNMIYIIVLLIMIIGILLLIFIPNDKVKNVASKNIEKQEKVEEEEDVVLNEKIIQYVDISELDENITKDGFIEIKDIEQEEKNQENDVDKNDNNISDKPYYIKVNYGAQVVTIYKKDTDGNYTIPVKAMVCSTGEATPTSGVYKIKERWNWLGLQGNVYGHYSTQIVGNILFHSVPYLERGNPASLEYWEYDKLGTYASAGCVRLTVVDALWIFNNCARGTLVEFYSSSNPGPLGKPTAKKISNATGELKNWDPTDPDSNNPWKTYKAEEQNKEGNKDQNKKEEEENSNKETNTNTNIQLDNDLVDDDKNNSQNNENIEVNEVLENDKIENEETKESNKETINEVI